MRNIFWKFRKFLIDKKNIPIVKKKLAEEVSKQKRNIFMFCIPQHVNLGDQAIAYAENVFIKENFRKDNYVEIFADETSAAVNILSKGISPDDVILIHGGGNLGDLYPTEEKNRRLIIKSFPNNKVISMPQSLFFSDTLKGQKELAKSKKIYSSHSNLVLFAREKMSFEKMKHTFEHNKIEMCPDIVLYLQKNMNKERKDKNIITMIRNDKESYLSDTDRDSLFKVFSEKKFRINISDTKLKKSIVIDDEKTRKEILEKKWEEISDAEIGITDRLHGMIFCYITKTPAIVFDNSYKKVSETYYTWLADCDYIHFMDNYNDIKLMDIYIQMKNSNRNNLDISKNYKNLIQAIASRS